MARYSLMVHDYEKDHDIDISFLGNGEISKNGKAKQELYFLDQFIFNRCNSREELINYLNKNGYEISKNSYAAFYYPLNGYNRHLSILYLKDPILEYFSLYFCHWIPKMNSENFKTQLLGNKTYQNYQDYLLKLFENNQFYSYLLDEKKFVSKYLLDLVDSYKVNKSENRMENERAYWDTKENIANYLTSYKQLRGLRLAILEFEKRNHVVSFDISKPLYELKCNIYKEKSKNLSQRKFESDNEEVNANIGYEPGMQIDEYNDNFFSTYDLENAPTNPWIDSNITYEVKEDYEKEIEEYERKHKRR